MKIIFIVLLLSQFPAKAEGISRANPSKCQSFVSRVFVAYKLPVPGMDTFSHSFQMTNIENYNQERPEFLAVSRIMATPRAQRTVLTLSGTIVKEDSYFLKLSRILRGMTLEEGSYVLTLSEDEERARALDEERRFRELNPPEIERQRYYRKNPLLRHRFYFSSNCEFQTYEADTIPGMAITSSNFFLSANSQCELKDSDNNNPFGDDSIWLIKNLQYYQELCLLAKEENSI